MKALALVAAVTAASLVSPAAAATTAPAQPAIETRPGAAAQTPVPPAPIAHVWLVAGKTRTELAAHALAQNATASDVTKPAVSGGNVAASAALGMASSLAGPFGGMVGQAGAMAIAKSAKAHGGQIAMNATWAMAGASAAATAPQGFALEIPALAAPLDAYHVTLVKLEVADELRTVTQTRLTYGQDHAFALAFAETAIPLTAQPVPGNRIRLTASESPAPGEYALVLRPASGKALDPAAAAAVIGTSADGSVPPWQFAWDFKVEART